MGRIGKRERRKGTRLESRRASQRRHTSSSEPELAPRTWTPNRYEATALGAAAISLNCSRYGATWCQQLGWHAIAREVPAVLILEGVGVALRRRHPVRRGRDLIERLAPERCESGVRLAPVIFLREQILADVTGCPNATQPEPFTVSILFLRPGRGNWQVACGIWQKVAWISPCPAPLLPTFSSG